MKNVIKFIMIDNFDYKDEQNDIKRRIIINILK